MPKEIFKDISKKKKVTLIVTGSIACYKAAEITRLLVKNNIEVYPVLTNAGKSLISEKLLIALSGNISSNDTSSDLSQDDSNNINHGNIEHINIARSSDLILVCPATANFINKISNGLADDIPSEIILAKQRKIPLVICPAMNVEMYNNPITQRSISSLKSDIDAVFIEPSSGILACGEIGIGKLADIKEIGNKVLELLNSAPPTTPNNHPQANLLKANPLKVLITLGRTVEKIDPVRYISNASSGLQGLEMVKAFLLAGHEITVISGVRDVELPHNIKIIDAQSHSQMQEAVLSNIEDKDIFISVAAVSDYSPIKISDKKIKKTDSTLSIELKQNSDILKQVCQIKHQKTPPKKNTPQKPLIVLAFSVESDNHIENGEKKILSKGCDLLYSSNLCFNKTETNGILFELKDNLSIEKTEYLGSKSELSNFLLQKIISVFSK